MYKALIFSDLHWSSYSSIFRSRGEQYSKRLHNLIDTLNWVEQLAVEKEVDEIISCGDTFDTPSLNAEEITALNEVNFNLLKKHLFLVGNHESNINTLEYSSTQILDKINSNIISTPTTIEINDKVNFTFIPYITGNVPSLGTFIKDRSKKNVVFAHQDIAGLQYGRFTSQSGFDVEDILANCTVFIDGHLHNEQTLFNNRIVLVGNTTGQNFGEDATRFDHLVYLLTVEDDGVITLEPYENPYALNFYKIRIDNDADLVKIDNLKNNAVVSITCNSKMFDKVNEYIKNSTKIVEHKLSVFYTNFDSNVDASEFKVEDHIKLFIQCAQEKFADTPINTPILIDELTRLQGGGAA